MALDLEKPIDHKDPAAAGLLADLQANILKGHGRHHTVNRFLRFDRQKAAAARAALATLAASGTITSAAKQLADTAAKNAGGPDDQPVVLLLLSRQGYDALGVPAGKIPQDDAFEAGMKTRRAIPGDPPATAWDEHLRSDIHAQLLVAHKDAARAKALADQISGSLQAAGITVLGDEIGLAIFNTANPPEGIEHFGFVDGRSQPLLLKDDVANEIAAEGPFIWDAAFSPIDQVLVRDPGGEGDQSFGSFFVFRKLEQDVKGFHAAEVTLAGLLASGSRDVAGAMAVGRFRDGTVLVTSPTGPTGGKVKNNFNYDGDPNGLTCPFQAHIRKTNPRGDVAREHQIPQTADRQPIMARRGIPYGTRADDHNSLTGEKPSGGVGLLFMAYQRSLVRQFEFTQQSWANDEGFLRAGTGIDPVIGQGGAVVHKWPNPPGSNATINFRFANFVHMRGGEYFFAPSISALVALARAPATS